MKLGFGLYRHMLNRAHYDFARQAGCTHIVVHLVDYFNQGNQTNNNNQPIGDQDGWGIAGTKEDPIWNIESLYHLKKEIQAAGLELEAIENFDPGHWYDILLDGPKKEEQIEHLKQIIRNVGEVGIPIFGYNFSLAGVASRINGNFARGNANTVAMDGVDERPIPNGMVWNMTYDSSKLGTGFLPKISDENKLDFWTFSLRILRPPLVSSLTYCIKLISLRCKNFN